MLKILNNEMNPVAILENAFEVGYTRILNEIWTAEFKLPLDDSKNKHCLPLNFVEIVDDNTGEYIGLYRIIPANTRKSESRNEIHYELEHVLSTLLNDVIFGYRQRSNYTTRENIEFLLNHQTTKHWRLGTCDFTRYFHYKWENENGLLGSLFSIAEPFDTPYVWTWDTQSYPWTLNLTSPSVTPAAEIRYGKNLSEIERTIDPSNIVNRLFVLGEGEGVNQLTFEKINNGLPYIEDAESITKYGVYNYIWVDRRFGNAESLFASAKALLDEWSIPKVSYQIKAIDLSSITGLSIDKFTVGKVIRIFDPDIGTFNVRVVREEKSDIFDRPWDVSLELTNTKSNVGTTLADIERRQEINEVYSQGSTTILPFSYQDNCDANIPAKFTFYVDDDVVNVNTVELTFETLPYRAYSETTENAGQIVKTMTTKSAGQVIKSGTTTNGGQTVKASTTGSGGGGVFANTSQSGGGSTQASSSGGEHTHVSFSRSANQDGAPSSGAWYNDGGSNRVYLHGISVPYISSFGVSQAHNHTVPIPNHSHGVNVSLPNHTHSFEFTLEGHTHEFSFQIEGHTHELEFQIEGHIHEVKHKIVELDRMPSRVTIKVDNNVVNFTSLSGDRINLVDYMEKDDNGRIIRGKHSIEILPDDLARIEANLILRVFIQSQLGKAL